MEVSILSEKGLKLKEDSVMVDIHNNVIDKIIIRSVVLEGDSIRDGVKIDNSKIELKLFFEQYRDIRESFQTEYNTILELCRFLTFRKYSAFDEVSLFSNKGSEDMFLQII